MWGGGSEGWHNKNAPSVSRSQCPPPSVHDSRVVYTPVSVPITPETSSFPASSTESHCSEVRIQQAHLDTKASKLASTLGKPHNQGRQTLPEHFYTSLKRSCHFHRRSHTEHPEDLSSLVAQSLWARDSQSLCWEMDQGTQRALHLS